MLQSFSIHLLDANAVRHYFISTWLKIELPHFPEVFRHLCFSAFFLRFVGCSSWWFQASNLRHTVSKRLVHVRGETNVMAKPWLFERWCRVFERDYYWCYYIYYIYVLFIVFFLCCKTWSGSAVVWKLCKHNDVSIVFINISRCFKFDSRRSAC